MDAFKNKDFYFVGFECWPDYSLYVACACLSWDLSNLFLVIPDFVNKFFVCFVFPKEHLISIYFFLKRECIHTYLNRIINGLRTWLKSWTNWIGIEQFFGILSFAGFFIMLTFVIIWFYCRDAFRFAFKRREPQLPPVTQKVSWLGTAKSKT